MKGTFFTADFVRDNSNNLRLIEVNTDTAIQTSLTGQLEWSGFNTMLTSNNISELHIIYKSVQAPLVENLISTLPEGITVEKYLEGGTSIYPTVVEDADNKFILRLAYDQGAILDSEYAAKDLSLYSLFHDNNQADKIPGFYYEGSHSSNVYNTLSDQVNDAPIADLLVRSTASVKGGDIALYKAPNGVPASIGSLKSDTSIITNYYKPLGASKASSIRSYQIVYGSELDLMFIGSYEIDAILEYPTSLSTDEQNKVERKHYSELTTEGVNRAAGVIKGQSIIRQDGGSDLAEAVIDGDIYASYFINGAPDTDNYGTLFTWSHPGSDLPEGSIPTGSTMIASHASDSANNSTIKVDLADGTSLKLGALSSILVYQVSSDTIKYLYVSELTVGDSLFDKDGGKKVISALNVEIHDTVEESTTIELNLESTDIFSVEGSSIIVHNGPCFVAGTKIAVEGGEKNIEDVEIGDMVLTYNEDIDNPLKELNKVLEVTEYASKETFILTTNKGTVVEATLDHPFMIDAKGWSSFDPDLCHELNDRYVNKLEIGDQVFGIEDYDPTAEREVIVSMEVQKDLKTVYNLANVENNHNFFVNGLLVHNRYK